MADQYCYSNNGLSMITVPAGYIAQSGEVLFDDYPTPAQLTAAFPGYIAALAAQDAPPPDLATQLAATLINAGTIPASALQAATLAQVNTALTAAGLATVTTQSTTPGS